MTGDKKSLSHHFTVLETPHGQVAVYTFQVWDRSVGANVVSPSMATPEAIRRLKGMAELESKRLVDASSVDSKGFYRGDRD
jgi:hypothetical protein